MAALLVMVACGSSSSYEETARVRAVEAAKKVIATPHDNMNKMERILLEAKAVQSEYIMIGDTIAANAFDVAFREYIVANDQELANELFN